MGWWGQKGEYEGPRKMWNEYQTLSNHWRSLVEVEGGVKGGWGDLLGQCSQGGLDGKGGL